MIKIYVFNKKIMMMQYHNRLKIYNPKRQINHKTLIKMIKQKKEKKKIKKNNKQ